MFSRFKAFVNNKAKNELVTWALATVGFSVATYKVSEQTAAITTLSERVKHLNKHAAILTQYAKKQENSSIQKLLTEANEVTQEADRHIQRLERGPGFIIP